MSKYAKTATAPRPKGVTTTAQPGDPWFKPGARTAEGGEAFGLDPLTELFTLATTSFLNGDAFYESGKDRDDRFVHLVQLATLHNAGWVAKFIPWLRNEANMRTASVVAAVEFARTIVGMVDHGQSPRTVLSSALQRADEPAEALAYHIANYGKPKAYAIKRGIGDAATRLYNEFSITKYDPKNAAVRPGDVIELTHPRPEAPWQSALFKYVLDRRHGREDVEIPEVLTKLVEFEAWKHNPTLAVLPNLVTWENLSSFFPMDKAAWEAVIPHMGYMALLRNLRNFEQAKVSERVLKQVADRLADPDQVARSRQLPFRFYSAYVNVHTERFRFPLSQALDLSCRNIPEFAGHTLLMIDVSGSMTGSRMSGGSSVPMVAQAALFASAVHNRCDSTAVYGFDYNAKPIHMSGSVLRNTENAVRTATGGATYTWSSLQEAWQAEVRKGKRPDRVMIFTDMQSHPEHRDANSVVPKQVPIHVWDLNGRGRANLQLGSGRYLHAGLTDHSFKVVKLLEDWQPGRWPWEVAVTQD